MVDKRISELIPAGSHGYDRWPLPSFDDSEHVLGSGAAEDDAALPVDSDAELAQQGAQTDQPVQPPTLEELEAIRQDAYNEGFAVGEQDGFHAGMLKARQEAEKVLAERVERLEQLMTHLLAPIQGQDQAIEQALVQLLSQLAQEVIRRELQQDSSHIRQVVQAALKLLPMGAENIRIQLNPQDFEELRQLRERHGQSWQLLEDEQILPGGCRIETAHSLIDASVETRLSQALAQLFEHQRQQAGQVPAADIHLELGGPDDA